GLSEEPDDSARVRGKHERGTIFIDRNLSLGHLLVTKHPFADGLNAQGGPLCGRWREQVLRRSMTVRHLHLLPGGAAGLFVDELPTACCQCANGPQKDQLLDFA